MMSIGAGLATSGTFPRDSYYCAISDRTGIRADQAGFCYHGLHGNIVTVGSAFDYAYLGCTHHCYGDFALMKTLQGVQITYPSTPIEFDTLFRQAYRNETVTVTVCRNQHGISFPANDIQLGKGIKVADGRDVTLVATGPQLKTAMGARSLLAQHELAAEVLYIHTIRPLDEELILASVSKTKRVVVIESTCGPAVLATTYCAQHGIFRCQVCIRVNSGHVHQSVWILRRSLRIGGSHPK